MNLVKVLAQLALDQPQRPALIDRRGQTLTFAQLEAEARRLAAVLGEHGAQPGQRVLLLTPMSAALYVTLAALWRIGLVAVVVDPGAGLAHLRKALGRVPPDIMVGIPASFMLMVLSEVRRIPLKVSVGWFPGAVNWHARPTLPPSETPLILPGSHPALITFTSGSTGLPKAAVRTHAFLAEQHRVLERHLGYTPGGIDLATLPVVALASLASGRTMLLPDTSLRRPARIDKGRVLRQLRQYPADTVAASPALLHTLGQAAVDSGQRLPFRHVFTGGGPVFPRTLALLQQAAPDAELVAVYGSTEVEPIAHQNWAEVTADDLIRTRAGGGLLAGKPIPELQVCIIPETNGPLNFRDGAELAAASLPGGQVGELLVSGAHVLSGYLDGVGNEETKWRDPHTGQVWHRTGDAATLDERGRLWLLGRAGKHVRDEGGELYPFAVEAAAMSYPGVARAALLPGRRILFVQWAGDPDPAVAEALAWAQLEQLCSVREIPLDRRHNAKVDYTRLAGLSS